MFRLNPAWQGFLGFVYAFMALVGTVGLVGAYSGDDTGGQVFMTFWVTWLVVQGWWTWFRTPYRVEASPSGLRFVARTRVIEISWTSLRSVESPWYDFGNQSLVWRWDEQRLRTWGWFQGLHRLLTMVEERAPQARLRGL